MRCWALNLVVSNDTRTIRRGRSGRRTMGPSIDGGPRIGPSMPQQPARKYRNPRVKMTRPTPKTRDLRSRSDAHQVPLDYRRPFKIGNIVQTSVNALGELHAGYRLRAPSCRGSGGCGLSLDGVIPSGDQVELAPQRRLIERSDGEAGENDESGVQHAKRIGERHACFRLLAVNGRGIGQSPMPGLGIARPGASRSGDAVADGENKIERNIVRSQKHKPALGSRPADVETQL